ncbi:MAG: GHKL domain-containing protein [Gammaproteobacteria bacterium]|nr:GHKL domain-containing protein [Gammaproteobacteria bacterium]
MTLTGLVLDKGFRNNVEHAQRENLRTQIYTLLATAELDENNKLYLPEDITEPRLNLPESTLHARVMADDKKTVWRSKSMLSKNIGFPKNIIIGELIFSDFKHNGSTYTLLNFATQWISDDGEQTYIFQISENKNVFNSQIVLFRKNLWGWLAGVSIILIIIQTIILRWGLKPLRHVAEELIRIEEGKAKKLSDDYPKEITPLTNNLNQLLDSSQQQLTRYRDALGNMAHSLKTPIAVLQGIINTTSNKEKEVALEQLATINNIVEFQLQRAATVGRLQLLDAIALHPTTQKIINTLNKVHKDKNINVQIDIADELMVKMDQGDLYELLGNLLENAYKWCNSKVAISAIQLNEEVQISIEDNGPGIDKNEQERILLRGQRADQNTPGHGLGLAMVNNILLLYKAEMKISDSPLGGTKIIIKI